ncbi:hypothetical protein ACFPVV_06940 [Macrococcoides bohemicum]|uniref:Uncharacterized protein n=1 Tax=Macrococcoides bohemicum TaxID=1903056 RepID=A0A327ZZH9_9STAP|nr:hypothetical protein [Macrococcus bohemicus]RAK47680.1 hypothetical protein BHX94_12555 [Macrococcus bohemicus]
MTYRIVAIILFIIFVAVMAFKVLPGDFGNTAVNIGVDIAFIAAGMIVYKIAELLDIKNNRKKNI